MTIEADGTKLRAQAEILLATKPAIREVTVVACRLQDMADEIEQHATPPVSAGQDKGDPEAQPTRWRKVYPDKITSPWYDIDQWCADGTKLEFSGPSQSHDALLRQASAIVAIDKQLGGAKADCDHGITIAKPLPHETSASGEVKCTRCGKLVGISCNVTASDEQLGEKA
jgi:hypothetical protein